MLLYDTASMCFSRAPAPELQSRAGTSKKSSHSYTPHVAYVSIFFFLYLVGAAMGSGSGQPPQSKRLVSGALYDTYWYATITCFGAVRVV